MNPRDLERRLQVELENEGWRTERAVPQVHIIHGRYVSNNHDFFNCFDLIALKDDKVRFIQVCSGTTLEDHKRKIDRTFPYTSNPIQEIVYFYKMKNRWMHVSHLRVVSGWLAPILPKK